MAAGDLQRDLGRLLLVHGDDLQRQVAPALEPRLAQSTPDPLDAGQRGIEDVVDDDARQDPARTLVLAAELGASVVAGHGRMVPRVGGFVRRPAGRTTTQPTS